MRRSNPLSNVSLPHNPVAIIQGLFGRRFSNETYFRVRKRGVVPYASLNVLDSLRHPAPAFLMAVPFFCFLFWLKLFFRSFSTGDAVENEAFYTVLVLVGISIFFSSIGQVTHYSLGEKPYRDPERFKNYLTELAKEIGKDHPCYQCWINPDLQNPIQSAQCLEFHLEVYEYLLREDPRAAAYMLTDFNRHFPYLYQPRGVLQVTPQQDDADPVVAVAAEPRERDDSAQRQNVARRVVATRLGIVGDTEAEVSDSLDRALNAIWQQAQQQITDAVAQNTEAAIAPTVYQQQGMAVMGQRPTMGAHIGLQHAELLTPQRRRVASDAPLLLAALNEACQQRHGVTGLFTPLSLDIFRISNPDTVALQLPQIAAHSTVTQSIDPLRINLIHGDKGCLAQVAPEGTIVYPFRHMAGFDAANAQDRQAAASCHEPLSADHYPNYIQDFQPGSIAVIFAQATRRSLQGKPASELTTWLRRFIGHRDPLQLDPGCVDIEAQLDARAHVLAHWFHDGKHYDRWQHWVAHSESNTAAFLGLSVIHQVWLIFTLLSGAPYAQLTAESLIRTLTLAQYNQFMRAYITFMQRYIQQENVPPIIADMRKMLFIEQLCWLTDTSLPRTRDFFNQHVQKPIAIMHALTYTLTDEDARRHQRKIAEFRTDPQAPLTLLELQQLQDHLKQQLTDVGTLSTDDLINATDEQKRRFATQAVIRDACLSCRWLFARAKAGQHRQKLYSNMTNYRLRFMYLHDVNEQAASLQPVAVAAPVPLQAAALVASDEHLRQVRMCIDAGCLAHHLELTVQRSLMHAADRERLAIAAQHLVALLAHEQHDWPNQDYPLLNHAITLIGRGVSDDISNEVNLQDRYFSFFMAALIHAALKQVGEQSADAAQAVIRLFLAFYRQMRGLIPIDYDVAFNVERPEYQWVRNAYAQYLKLYPQSALNEHIRRLHWERFIASYIMLHHPQVVYSGHEIENDAFRNLVVLVERSLMPNVATNTTISLSLQMLDHCLFYHANPIAPDANALGYPKINAISATTWRDLLSRLQKCHQSITDLTMREQLKAAYARVVNIVLQPARLAQGVFCDFSRELYSMLAVFNGPNIAARFAELEHIMPEGYDELRLRVAVCYRLYQQSPSYSARACAVRIFQSRASRMRDSLDARVIQQILPQDLPDFEFFNALGVSNTQKFFDWLTARKEQLLIANEREPLLQGVVVN